MSTGTETLRRSADARKRAASEVIRHAKPIPGYTGHLRGHSAENVFAATFGEAIVVAHEAKDRRSDTLPGDPVLTHTHPRTRNFDNGSLNTTMGSKLSHEPISKAVSTFHNPRGHNFRAGASIPGYAGYIPGKVPGNCFGKRVAMDNLHATETRRINDEGADGGRIGSLPAKPTETGWDRVLIMVETTSSFPKSIRIEMHLLHQKVGNSGSQKQHTNGCGTDREGVAVSARS
eukprot:CAMPEP_0197634086 /NCGR_PEP_ID=MMETSP1338-20131121/10290_1 /TAXON_ID=43686 ORGANISM="Pelagodinium beii, Strain RCC1491" /NCGR_SAMPLE_ID=MMETSP1338 /ASSEMBLY_ACC=CAM_ASM_000754 /LENGTH=231 /DNA_ID=CAMNT_0043205885 /DNA_START=48 /DNA_END=741 /DNA_ORIENTATION=-